ncbi:hypothetical protein HS125_11850 [bacterium]|nr:hypothetical protein [bacterium]
MVEKATAEALARNFEALGEVLSDPLRRELAACVNEAVHLPNWQDGGRWLSEQGFSRLSAEGPISKVLRALAFALERLAQQSPPDLRVSEIRLSRCRSGCSTYSGEIVAVGELGHERVELLSGRFLWDCAAWGVPSDQAARERGYACMVEFPAVIETSSA